MAVAEMLIAVVLAVAVGISQIVQERLAEQQQAVLVIHQQHLQAKAITAVLVLLLLELLVVAVALVLLVLAVLQVAAVLVVRELHPQ
jgi:hypothetical protein